MRRRQSAARRGGCAGAEPARGRYTPVFVCFTIPTVHYVSFFIRSAYNIIPSRITFLSYQLVFMSRVGALVAP